MSIPGAASPLFLAATAAGPAGAFEISRSLRFNSGDSAHLSRTPSSASNRKTWTWSGWVKRSAFGASYEPTLFSASAGGSNPRAALRFTTGNALEVGINPTGSSWSFLTTSSVYRDLSAWYHIVLSVDTTQSTASNRTKLYVNGIEITDFSSSSYVAQDADTPFNFTYAHSIGRYEGENSNTGYYFNGYLAEINFVDGSALAPTSFGAFDDNGVWQAKDTSGLSFGTNGFRLKFADNSSDALLGTDSSGNSNTWTVNNLSVGSASNRTAQQNFDVVAYTGTASTQSISSLAFQPDFVWLKRRNGAGNHNIQDAVRGASKFLQSDYNGAEVSSGSRLASFDSNGFTLTSDNGGNASGGTYVAWCWSAGANSNKTYTVKVVSDSGNKYRFDDFGTSAVTLDLAEGSTYIFDQSDSSNAGHPIRFGTSSNGTDYTTGVTHTGTPGSAGAKTTLVLASGAATLYYSCLNHSGMGGQINTNSTAGASNFAGSIQSNVKANADYGFSVVSYTGDGSGTDTIGHGLNAAPSLVITKSRGTTGPWRVFTDVGGTLKLGNLNNTDAFVNATVSAPTSSVFSIDGNSNAGTTHIAYVWSEVAGFSKFGSYTGSGSSGKTVTTGFKPRFVLVKRTTNISGSHMGWSIVDSERGSTQKVQAQSAVAENDGPINAASPNDDVTFNDDGFTLASGGAASNASGETYIYMAFAATILNQPGIDSLVDTPTNAADPTDTGVGNEVVGNYATLNPLDSTTATLSNGNLDCNLGNAATHVRGTFQISSGKWYWEITPTSLSGDMLIGICLPTQVFNGDLNTSVAFTYYNDGRKFSNGSGSSYGASYTVNDVIGVAFDADAGTLTYYKNGVSQGTAFTGLTAEYFPAVSDGSSGAASSFVINFGQRAFAYPLSGYKSLNTANLPTPTIADGSLYFDAKLYTGTGSNQSLTGLAFQSDFVWIKTRNEAENHFIVDSVRGVTKQLYANITDAEYTNSNRFKSFDSNGFTVGTTDDTNQSGNSFVAWAWDGGTSTVTNNDGSIASSVRASAASGFSIVSYAGNSVNNSTIGHGLNAAPELIITKNRDGAYNWITYSAELAATKVLALDGTYAAFTPSGGYYSNVGNSTYQLVQGSANLTNVNNSGNDYIAYCFAPVNSYSSMGSFTGNGNADGPFVYTGFKSSFVLIKETGNANSWYIYDAARNTFNTANNILWAQSTNSESAIGSGDGSNQNGLEILSNGFKIPHSLSGTNRSGGTFLYAAFASNPFQANGGLAR